MAIRIVAASHAPVALRAGDAHVWCASLDRPEWERAELHATLSPAENARARRYLRSEDGARFIVRRGVLRSILGAYAGVAPGEVCLSTHASGKPVLDGADNTVIAFNVSHSMGLGLFAFARVPRLGVDVEHVRAIPEMDDIVLGAFSAHERSFLDGLAVVERTEAFLRIWTRKEACAKAVGVGLTIPLHAIEVPLGVSNSFSVARVRGGVGVGPGDEVADLHVTSFVPARGFVAALATPHAALRVVHMSWKGGG